MSTPADRPPGPDRADLAVDICALMDALVSRGLHLGVAESLTGGLVLSRLTAVPGCSEALVGGVVAYLTEIKESVLGVDHDLVEREGPVHPEVALQMARGIRALMGAEIGVATTGEAGPDSGTGKPVGLFYAAISSPELETVQRHQATGTRADVREAAVAAALDLLWQAAGGERPKSSGS